MDKIKVLQIIGSADIGGAEAVFCSLLKYLDKDRFDIFVACPGDGLMVEDFKRFAKEVKTFNFKNWFNLLTVISLKKYIQQRKIDIVHTHLYNGDFIGILAGLLAGAPYRITTVHGHNFRDIHNFDLRSAKNLLFSFVYRFIYKFCDKIIVVCEALKKDLIEWPGIKVDGEKIEIIYNGFDLEKINESNRALEKEIENVLENNIRYVGIIGKFDRIKGHRILLKAIPLVLKEVDQIKFLLVGDGEQRVEMERLVKKFGIDEHVILTGAYANVLNLIKLCELIVVPSFSEGLPLSLLEAMALAKPVVATGVGGIPELVRENESGVLVPPNGHEKLAIAIINILRDKELALSMGRKGKEIIFSKINSKFQAQYMTKELERLYQILLGYV